MNNIDRQVLAAFQVEHKEHIEGIRSLVDDFERTAFQRGDARFDEAFRLAHSLKGGARVCNLRAAERLGHQLEALFAAVRQGEMVWQTDVVHVVNMVLDAIEDWMEILADGGQPPEPDAALAAINHLLGESAESPASTVELPEQSALQQELHAAFSEEYAAYVAELRRFFADRRSGSIPSPESAEEAFRNAHSLYCAAQAAELFEAQAFGKQLAEMLAPLRHRQAPCDEQLIRNALTTLAELESAVKLNLNDPTVQTRQTQSAPAAKAIEERVSSGGQSPRTSGTVRVQTSSLDQLVRSSAQLLSELNSQNQIEIQIGQLSRELEVMRRDRRNCRHLTATGLDGPSQAPRLGRLANYLEGIDRRLESCAEHVQKLQRLHSRHEWLLRSHGQQIHEYAQQARMIPVESVFQGFRKLVRDLARDLGKQVDFTLRGLEQRADRLVLQTLKDPLIHILRNAVVHGIESPEVRFATGKPAAGKIQLVVEATTNQLRITIADDGQGLDRQAIHDRAAQLGFASTSDGNGQESDLTELVVQPGFSTLEEVSELAGRGMGLSVVQKAVTRLQGALRIQSQPHSGTRVELGIPLSVATRRVLLVRCGGHTCAIGVSNIEKLVRLRRDSVGSLEGKPVVMHQEQPVRLLTLRDVLSIAPAEAGKADEQISVAIVRAGTKLVALAVDALLAEREALVHDLTGPAADVATFSGAVLLGDGTVALVLNPAEVVERQRTKCHAPQASSPATTAEQTKLVLVVDDSFTTRTLEKSILEAHGFEVQTAIDGVEALSLLRSQQVDLVISDIEMPRMDGFELLEQMKADHRLRSLPFVLVTSRDQAHDKETGLNLGADAYIIKQKFNHQELLDTIRQIL